MKKIEKSIIKNYLPVKVFLDDLEAIESALKEFAENIVIETDGYSFSSTDELITKYKNQSIRTLEISIYNPCYIHIEFSPLWVKLYSGSDSTSATGLFYKLDSILSSATRKPEFFYSYTFFILFTVIINASSFFLPKELKVVAIICNSIYIIWVCYFSYIRLMNSAKIIMTKRHDLKSFFQRNKDALIVNSFVGIVTIFVTLLLSNNWSSIQLFLKGIFKP